MSKEEDDKKAVLEWKAALNSLEELSFEQLLIMGLTTAMQVSRLTPSKYESMRFAKLASHYADLLNINDKITPEARNTLLAELQVIGQLIVRKSTAIYSDNSEPNNGDEGNNTLN